MKIIHSPQTASRLARQQDGPLILVPTMGALHRGHAMLVKRAVRLAGSKGRVWVSIFVNPTQFGPSEDFSKYPRTLREDAALCEKLGVDVVFAPDAASMYASDHSVYVDELLLSRGLCGASRPGHFRGVCTVVSKLFNIVAPDTAVFGQKDYQQLAIIRRMVRDLHYSVKIVGVPTVREPDGLALSSRNAFLSADERAQAPVLRCALLEAEKALKNDRSRPAAVKQTVLKMIKTAPLARPDYVEILDAETLLAPGASTRKMVAALAVFFGKTRLIDNITI